MLLVTGSTLQASFTCITGAVVSHKLSQLRLHGKAVRSNGAGKQPSYACKALALAQRTY